MFLSSIDRWKFYPSHFRSCEKKLHGNNKLHQKIVWCFLFPKPHPSKRELPPTSAVWVKPEERLGELYKSGQWQNYKPRIWKDRFTEEKLSKERSKSGKVEETSNEHWKRLPQKKEVTWLEGSISKKSFTCTWHNSQMIFGVNREGI